MPRYDFRCTPCQWTFEATIPFGSDELPPCPQCRKKATERVISPPLGIHFHGSGFYKTDSRPAEKAKLPAEKGQVSATPEKTTGIPHPDHLPKGEGMTAPPPSPQGEGIPKNSTTEKKMI